jgi:mannose-1-phosphate guanylyltransferase
MKKQPQMADFFKLDMVSCAGLFFLHCCVLGTEKSGRPEDLGIQMIGFSFLFAKTLAGMCFAITTLAISIDEIKMDRKTTMDYSHVWAVVLAGGEGTRVRSFLQQFCGGSGLKQFSTIIGERSMLRCTLDRVVRLIPPERVLIVVSAQHRDYAEHQLAHWPRENIIFQPANRDTAPGILLPLAHITNRDPGATVVVFPSDHFILDEERFMGTVKKALIELKKNASRMILLGMPPQRGEETEYGYIVGTRKATGGADAMPVAGFVEKPPLAQAKELIQRGALWNTMVFAVENSVLWDMVQRTSPLLYHAFRMIQMTQRGDSPAQALEHIYQAIPAVNFSSAICEPLAARLCVLPVPDVGWSDWGTAGSILRTLKKLGEFEAFYARAPKPQLPMAWQASKRATGRAVSSRAALNASPST